MTDEEKREYHREKSYESWLRHKEECAAKKKIYYQEHREEICEKARANRKPLTAEQKEEARIYHKQYYKDNREKILWQAKVRYCRLGA